MRSLTSGKKIRIKLKNNNKKINNNYNIILGGLSGVFLFCLGFFIHQGYIFYQCNLENSRLLSLKNEYEELILEINNYKELKGQYEIILDEGNDLNSNKEELQKKVNTLNGDIKNLESKIVDINKKIKSLS